MPEMDHVSIIQERLNGLSEKYTQLQEKIAKLEGCLRNKEFISADLYQTSISKLEELYEEQESVIKNLQQLPDFVLEAKSLADLDQDLNEYASLQNQTAALQYVIECSSQNEKVQSALADLQSVYKKAIENTLEAEEIERLYALSLLFKEALEETDSFERYLKADQLKPQLDPILCFGLSNGLIEHVNAAAETKEVQQTESSALEERADLKNSNEMAEPESKPDKIQEEADSKSIEQAEPNTNDVLKEDPSLENAQSKQELEMQEEPLKKEEAVSSKKEKSAKPKSKDKADLDKEQPEVLIASYLEAELRNLFAPDPDEMEEETPDPQYEQECLEKAQAAGLFEEIEKNDGKVSDAWLELGIKNPSCVTDGYNGLKVNKRKPANLKENLTRNAFVRKLIDEEEFFSDAISVIRYFYTIHPYYITKTCFNYISKTPYAIDMKYETAFNASLHRFYENGLVNKFSMRGVEDVYCPSKTLSEFLSDKKGKRCFSRNDLLKNLVSKKMPFYESVSEPEMMFFQADSICGKNAFMLSSYTRADDYMPEYGTSSVHIVSVKNKPTVAFGTIFARTAKDFGDYLDFYFTHAPYKGIFICVQSDLKKARMIATWLDEMFSSGLKFYAMDYKENIAYRLDGKDLIDFNDETCEFIASYQQAAKDSDLFNEPMEEADSISETYDKIYEQKRKNLKESIQNKKKEVSAASRKQKESAPVKEEPSKEKQEETAAGSEPGQEKGSALKEQEGIETEKNAPTSIYEQKNEAENSSKEEIKLVIEDLLAGPVKEEHEEPKILESEEHESKTEQICSLLAEKEFYAASLYAKILQNMPDAAPEHVDLYDQLAYALNDPLKHPSYDSESIVEAFSNLDFSLSSYLYIAAALRTFFYDDFGFDYSLSYLADSLKSLPFLKECPPLETLLFLLLNFKKEHDYQGVDAYANYRMQERNDVEQRIIQIVGQCKDLYQQLIIEDQIKDKHNNRCYTECRHLIFAKDSPLGLHLEIAANNETDLVSEVEEYLLKNFITEKMPVAPENISPLMINKLLDESWHNAKPLLKGTANADKLIGTARKILEKYVTLCIKALCQWCVLVKNPLVSQNNAALADFRRIEEDLKTQIYESLSYIKANTSQDKIKAAGLAVLQETLQELEQRMDGSWSVLNSRYYYVPFLKQNYILLDENYLPILEEIKELPAYTMEKRLLYHLQKEKEACFGLDFSWKERLAKINEGMEDNFGINDLIIDYLTIMGTEQEKEVLSSYIYASKENRSKGKALHEARYQDFKSYLELAKAYGQMDDMYGDQKEMLELCIEHLYEQANESQNYGYFGMLLEQMKAQIQSSFSKRKEQLKEAVDQYQKQEENESLLGKLDVKKQNMIQAVYDSLDAGNYTAAEDLFNRLSHNDLDDSFKALSTDLEDFLADYERLYLQTNVLSRDLKQLVSIPSKNKEGRGGQKLIDNWPKNGQEAPDKIKNMLIGLGFPASMVVSKDKNTLAPDASYTVMLPKSSGHGRKTSYSHPIAAFGSEMEEQSIRVLCFFGRLDSDAIIEKCNQRSEQKNTIIFANTTLNKADRRRFARKSKSELSEKIFLLVDRVAISWLAQNYSAETIARKLMRITLPFSYGQLYVEKSTEPIPPEMFIGRKSELEKIRDPKGVNLVHGGRQLGKSALLAMAKHQVDKNENNDRALVVDIKGLNSDQACKKVSTALIDAHILDKRCVTEEWSELCYFIRNRLEGGQSPSIPYLLLMMDEADAFIESCKQQAYKPIDALKELENTCFLHFKFVLAGLHNVVRFDREAALSSNSSLAHLSSLSVRPFKYSEARSLLEIPLHYAGFRFGKDEKSEQLISMILGHTNYFPSLIQFYCAKLIESLQENYASYSEADTPPYLIGEKQIQEVLRQESLNEEIKKKFFITLHLDEDDYYYILALMIALRYHTYEQASSSAKEIYDLAAELECKKILDLNLSQVQALLEEMRELNILQADGKQSYRFSRNSFLTNMGEPHEIEDALMTLLV